MAGEMVHVEFPCEDADRAARFWKAVFGWDFQGAGMEGMDYRMAQVADGQGSAIYPTDRVEGHPKVYFGTPDIGRAIAAVREMGGEAAERSPVPGHGWYAACKDSEGNEFHLWQQDASAG